MDIEGIGVFIAPASARSEHRATAPTRAGRKALDKALPDDEARPRALYDKSADTTSRPTTGARWWWSISPPPPGALALAVAQDMGITVGYPPELSMRRTADPAPDSAKTDAKDAAVIAGAARTMPPHPARHQHLGGGHRGAEHALTGFDPDPARQVNQSEGRIRASSPPHDPQRGAAAGERGRGPVVKPSPRPATNDGTIRSRSTHRIGPRRRMPSHAPFSMRPENRPAPGDSHDWSRFRRLPGAAYRTRTDDLLFTRQLLYQLS